MPSKTHNFQLVVIKGHPTLSDGLYLQDPSKPESAIKVAGHFEVLYQVRDAKNNGWGVLLSWVDAEQHEHFAIIRLSAMYGSKRNETIETLVDGGLYLSSNRQHLDAFFNYLQTTTPLNTDRLRTTNRIGWVMPGVYVLPDRTFGKGVFVLYDGPTIRGYTMSGSLQEWKDNIARYALGNSRLIFVLSLAFLGVLLKPFGINNLGFHFLARTSIGKTTALDVASSVLGNPAELTAKWSTTINALEGICVSHNDGFLAIDELGQCDSGIIGDVAYLMNNGQGKSRQSKEGHNREVAEWHLVYLSAGEEDLTEKLAKIGQRAKGGQELRLLAIPGEAPKGMGLFEDLHGFPNPGAFSNHLKQATARFHGTALVHFLTELCTAEKLPVYLANYHDNLKSIVESFELPEDASSDIQRTARNFASVALAGEIASDAGTTSWPAGTALHAVQQMFQEWLSQRESPSTAIDDLKFLRHVRRILESDGGTRLPALTTSRKDMVKYRDRLGFTKFDDESAVEYLILPEQFDRVFLAGQANKKRALQLLTDRGWLDADKDRATKKRTLPDSDVPVRVYVLLPNALSDDLS